MSEWKRTEMEIAAHMRHQVIPQEYGETQTDGDC
jgi:hypothetical protein